MTSERTVTKRVLLLKPSTTAVGVPQPMQDGGKLTEGTMNSSKAPTIGKRRQQPERPVRGQGHAEITWWSKGSFPSGFLPPTVHTMAHLWTTEWQLRHRAPIGSMRDGLVWTRVPIRSIYLSLSQTGQYQKVRGRIISCSISFGVVGTGTTGG